MDKITAGFYTAGTFSNFEMFGPDAGGDRVWIRYWTNYSPDGMGRYSSETLEVPLDLVLKFAEQYNKQHNKGQTNEN